MLNSNILDSELCSVHHDYDNVCVFGAFNSLYIDWSGNEYTPNLGSCGSALFRNIAGTLRDREVACSTSDLQGLNF